MQFGDLGGKNVFLFKPVQEYQRINNKIFVYYKYMVYVCRAM